VSYYANRAERLNLIAGLLALAKFLEENEEVPSPKCVDVMVFPHKVTTPPSTTAPIAKHNVMPPYMDRGVVWQLIRYA
jgi:hypothetical protein